MTYRLYIYSGKSLPFLCSLLKVALKLFARDRIDYYPSSSTESFVEHMKPLYDKYCQDGSILFAIGETG